jgi:hypothetical protein
MPKLTLTYFDFDGGRGEPARLALSIAGIAFEDRRVTFDAWKISVRSPRSGSLDHVPADIVDRTVPALVGHAECLGAFPAISAYYAGRQSAHGDGPS